MDTLAADVNGDNNLTRQDAMILSRHIAGWTEFEELRTPIRRQTESDVTD